MKNKFFDLKLYIEGIKRLKVIGTAFAVISFGMAFLVPLTYGYRADGIEAEDFISPLVVLMVAAIVLVNRVFGYLTSRKKSDFYHSIPLPRKCVYFSFMASALTWVWGILIVSLLIESFMWGFDFYLSTVLLVGVAFAVATLFIMAVMSVARILTGTEISSMALFAILFLFLRVCGTIAMSAMKMLVPIYDFEHSFLHYLGFEFFLPFRVIMLYDTDGIIPLIIYTFIISVATIWVGAILYTRRKSEMAGNNAPSPMLHNIYRYAISTPLFLLATEVVLEFLLWGRGYMLEDSITILACAFAVYFLYELITRKNIKKMFASAKNLWVIFLIVLIYCAGLLVARNQILDCEIEADDIESVELINNNTYYVYPENYKIFTVDSDLSKACVAQAYKASCEDVKNEETINRYRGVYTLIRLKSGREIYCWLVNFEGASRMYSEYISKDLELSSENMSLPSINKNTHTVFYVADTKTYDYREIYLQSDTRLKIMNTFYEEYYSLSDEQKAILKTNIDTTAPCVIIWEEDNDDKYDYAYICKGVYYIPDFMPETYAAIYRNAE
ncbi:MAG: hypothetical protein J6A83_09795 [Clostridia bacterium]|nr:hypothetical protein [Clostridia bacterium]MBP3369339.1 hypothetical protein [Clostridia bacterium]